MKRILKLSIRLFVLLVIILILSALYIHFADIPYYEPYKVNLNVSANPEMVDEGARLASMLCNNCHMSADNRLSGRLLSEAPPEFGTIYSSNITGDKVNGIGEWTDGQIAVLLRTGVKRDGRYAPFYMPKFTHLSDQDMHNIIAYLRSDRPEVKPVATKPPACRPSFLVKFLCRVAWKPFDYPSSEIKFTDTLNEVAYGRYLVTGRYDCYPCHSEDFTKIDFIKPENTPGFMGGGNKLLDMSGAEIFSANLTPDPETGIGKWDFPRFREALVNGRLQEGLAVRYPMLPYNALKEAESRAIFAYLRQIPSRKNAVNRGTNR